MLVLSRRPGEKIVVGDDITITLVEISGNKVQIGIDAPKDCPVHRQEIHDRLHPVAARLGDGSAVSGS